MSKSELLITRRNLPHWRLSGSTYFVTFRVGKGDLSLNERHVVLDAIKHFHGQRYWIWTSVVMPDHVHLLLKLKVESEEKGLELGAVIKSVKGFTAREINKTRNSKGPLWQDEYFDRIVRDEDELREKWSYIRNNPVKKELADTPEHYEFLWEPG